MDVLLNERAAADPRMREALVRLRARGHKVEARLLLEPGDAMRLAGEAAAKGIDAVVAAGGDGTLHEVVNGVVRSGQQSRCAVAVVPFGTANDFAAMCDIPLDDPLKALELIESDPIHIDLGRMNDRLFVNVASGGFGAEVTAETSAEAKQVLGGFAYFLKGLASVTNINPRHVEINAPGFAWSGAVLSLSVGNGRQAGGGFQVCPNALLNDGLLDVVVVPEVARDSLLALARDLLRLGKDSNHGHIISFQAPWIDIRARDGLQVNLDGEPVYGDSFRFEALERVLPFYLPSAAPLSPRSEV